MHCDGQRMKRLVPGTSALRRSTHETRQTQQRETRETTNGAVMRGWRNKTGNLIEFVWFKTTYRRPQFTGTCVKTRGVRLHRIRDLKQYYFNSNHSANLSFMGNGEWGVRAGGLQDTHHRQPCTPLLQLSRTGRALLKEETDRSR